MVRIIDGEIVQDDDPRLRRPSAPPAAQRGPAPPAATMPAGGPAALAGSPFRVVPPQPGDQGLLAGLPSVEAFGVLFPGIFFLVVGGAAIMFGWRALVGLTVVWVIYQLNKQQPAAGGGQQAGGPQRQGLTAQQQQFYQTFMGGRGAGAGQQQSAQEGGQAGPFKGRSYKLSG